MGRSRTEPVEASTIRLLFAGFACTVVLAVLTLGMSGLGSSRAEKLTLQLAEESQRSTYYMGDIGEQLARLRAHVALGLTETPAQFERRAALIDHIESLLQTALAVVPSVLDRTEQRRWDEIRSEVVRLQQAYLEAANDIRRRHGDRASRLLAAEASSATTVHDALDELQHSHRDAMLAKLRSAQGRERHIAALQIALAMAFLLGMIVIWGVMVGVLRRQQRLVHEYTTRLESANADLDAFAGRVAHDLKNALSPLMIEPATLRRLAPYAPRVLERADRFERYTRRAVGLIDALLAFSRASRQVELDESGGLRGAVLEALEELQTTIEAQRITVEAADIPDCHVRCSRDLLHIVIANLCGNAVKFMRGRPERRLRIAATVEGAMCRIDVEDTGPGIPSSARARIFEPFYRVSGSGAPGTGIGLATVRRIVEARGGRITVDSTEDAGTCFHFWLPIAAAPRERPAPRDQMSTPTATV